MKFTLPIIFIALIGGYWVFFRGSETVPTQKAQEETYDSESDEQDSPTSYSETTETQESAKIEVPSPSPTPTHVKVATVQKPAPAVRKKPNRFPPNLSKDQMAIQIKEDGYAIAQGDILMGKVAEEQRHLKMAVTDAPKTLLWDTPTIPFLVAENVPSLQIIQEAISYFNKNTPVRFVNAAPEDKDIIVFLPTEDLCASRLGKVGGQQAILVSPRCGFTEVLHELMHALGFVHEHARQDRDKYVEVLWDNIPEIFKPQFNIIPAHLVHNYAGSVFNFDPQSIMLYPDTAFAKAPGLKTLKALGIAELKPTRGGLSSTDLERVYYLYGR